MKFFVDTADVAEIRELAATGLLDGVTTNPSLVAKSGRDFKQVIAEICAIIPGPVSAEVTAKSIEPNKRIVIEWPGYSGPTTVTWTFREVEGGTFLEVEETGWSATGDELVKYVCDSTGGFTWTLSGMKAWLEHGLELNLIADRFPKELGGH